MSIVVAVCFCWNCLSILEGWSICVNCWACMDGGAFFPGCFLREMICRMDGRFFRHDVLFCITACRSDACLHFCVEFESKVHDC